MLSDKDYTKEDKAILTMMIVGGLLITIMTILPIGDESPSVMYRMIIVNVVYWALTLIFFIIVENSTTRRLLNSKMKDGSEMMQNKKNQGLIDLENDEYIPKATLASIVLPITP